MQIEEQNKQMELNRQRMIQVQVISQIANNLKENLALQEQQRMEEQNKKMALALKRKQEHEQQLEEQNQKNMLEEQEMQKKRMYNNACFSICNDYV